MKKLFFLVSILFTMGYSHAQESQGSTNLLTPDEKVFGLSKFWQEVNYNFVYLDKIDRKVWDSTYLALIPIARETKNDWEYYKVLRKFCAVLNDGHTYITRPPIDMDQTGPKAPNEVYVPQRDCLFKDGYLMLSDIDGKIIVTVVNKNLGATIPMCSEVLKVNGLPVEQYITEYTRPYVSNSTEHIRRYQSVRNITNGVYGEHLSLTIKKPDGKMADINLTFGGTSFDFPEGKENIFRDPNKEQKLLDLEWHGNIAYIALNSFSNREIINHFKDALPEIRKAEGLVIDIRNNGGGNTDIGTAILEYLTPDDKLYGGKSRTRQNIAAFRAWGRYQSEKDTVGNEWATKAFLAARDKLYYDLGKNELTVTPAKSERIVVPTVILTGNFTASAAEDFLIYADNQRHMTRIGEKTYGSTGQPLQVSLIKGFGAGICTKEDTYADGREFVGVGIIPHIEIKPTLNDYLSKTDPALNKAIEHVKAQIKK